MLKFWGRGSATNMKEDSNSAYFIENGKLFLIDCGETTARQIISSGILDKVSEVYLFVTHTHSDHVGSVGTLATKLFYDYKKPLKVIVASYTKQNFFVTKTLEACGADPLVEYIDIKSLRNKLDIFIDAKYVPTTHTEKYDGITSHGIEFITKKGLVYYTGDTNQAELVASFAKIRRFKKLYVDTSLRETPVHLSLSTLDAIIPKDARARTFCMHVDSNDCIKKAIDLGFQVVKPETV